MLVYAGAIMVLFLFVIMLLNLGASRRRDMRGPLSIGGGAWRSTGLLVVELARALGYTPDRLAQDARLPRRRHDVPGASPPTRSRATSCSTSREPLFHAYLVPFEITSILLLAAIVGAVVLAQAENLMRDLLGPSARPLRRSCSPSASLGVLLRRNAIILFMCVELMLNAVNLTFVALAQVLRRRRAGLRLLRDDGRGRRGGGRAGDHPRDLPPPARRWTSQNINLLHGLMHPASLPSRLRRSLAVGAVRPVWLRRRFRSPASCINGARSPSRAPAGRKARWCRRRSAPARRCWRAFARRRVARASLAAAWRRMRAPRRRSIVTLWQLDAGRATSRSTLAFQVDQLSVVMLLVVTGVGALIHLFSVGYMQDDPGYARYFAYLNLFVVFMLVLVLGVQLPGAVRRLGRASGSAPTC